MKKALIMLIGLVVQLTSQVGRLFRIAESSLRGTYRSKQILLPNLSMKVRSSWLNINGNGKNFEISLTDFKAAIGELSILPAGKLRK